MAVFGQDPEVYLEQEHILPYDVVDPKRHVVIDPRMRTFVNYEVFFFADEKTKATFEQDPLRYCGLLTDPVSRQRFHPAPGSRPFDYKGRPYYFASDSTLTVFAATPDSFATRKGM